MNQKKRSEKQQTILEAQGAEKAIEENLFSFIRAVAPVENNEFHEDNRGIWFNAGFSAPSMLSACVYNFQNQGKEVKVAVAEQLQIFKERKVPVLWTIGPSSGRALKEALDDSMMHVQTQAGMAIDLSSLSKTNTLPGDVEVVEIQEASQLLPWFKLYNACFEQAPALSFLMAERYEKAFLDRELPMRHYIAYLQGRPAATASFYSENKVTGIYNIVTAPEARGRGIGEFMTRHVLLEGRKRGDTIGILQATPAGEPVYRRIGFEQYCTIDMYIKLFGSSLVMVPLNLLRVKVSNMMRKIFS